MNYTKGEWRADNGESELWGVFQKEDCQGIAYLCEPNGTLLRPEQAKANAHLIAAAPDMYEKLEELMKYCYGRSTVMSDDWGQLALGITKVLAKAEGREAK